MLKNPEKYISITSKLARLEPNTQYSVPKLFGGISDASACIKRLGCAYILRSHHNKSNDLVRKFDPIKDHSYIGRQCETCPAFAICAILHPVILPTPT